jgi:uncharacterized repeat protein (TIGR01451 family)
MLVVAGLATVLLIGAGGAAAAPGDILRTINMTPPAGCGVSVGIAFDGSELIVSESCDNFIYRVSPADGTVLGYYAVAGLSGNGIQAMSWDAKDSLLWLESGGTIWSAVLDKPTSTGVATPRFNPGGGFTDGLAFDGTDDTIWYSPDVSSTIYHYTQAGTLIGTRSGILGNCGNSGLVVADATSLYMANNGCGEIWFGDKAGTTTTLFASLAGKRVEDLECDNTTFAPKSVIWSKDAYDYELNAFEVTAGQCAQGGVVPVGADVGIVKTAPATVKYRYHIRYTLTITNNGPDTADNVMVSDTLPAGLAGPTASSTKGTCSVGPTITCDLGSLTSGETETVTIFAEVRAQHGTLTNTASVSSSTNDPVPANNSSTASTEIVS